MFQCSPKWRMDIHKCLVISSLYTHTTHHNRTPLTTYHTPRTTHHTPHTTHHTLHTTHHTPHPHTPHTTHRVSIGTTLSTCKGSPQTPHARDAAQGPARLYHQHHPAVQQSLPQVDGASSRCPPWFLYQVCYFVPHKVDRVGTSRL